MSAFDPLRSALKCLKPCQDPTAVIEEGPQGCLWPPFAKGSFRQWLFALGVVALLLIVFTALFSVVRF